MNSAAALRRSIEIELDTPTEAGETVIRLWTNLPAAIDMATIAALYRKRWRIEGMFQRLESVLHSEIKSLGHPRAALLGFTVAVLGYTTSWRCCSARSSKRIATSSRRWRSPAITWPSTSRAATKAC